MRTSSRARLTILLAISIVLSTGQPALAQATKDKRSSDQSGQPHKQGHRPSSHSLVLKALKQELDRSYEKLKTAGDAPLYFLAYRVYDTETVNIKGSFGGLLSLGNADKRRSIDVDVRVGSPEQDNTHNVRGSSFGIGDVMNRAVPTPAPIEDSEDALRVALWQLTDSSFKSAQKQYALVKTSKSIKVEEEDTSADFSLEAPQLYSKVGHSLSVDRPHWDEVVRRLSRIYREYKDVIDSEVNFSVTRTVRYLVTSEGTELEDERVHYRVFTTARTIADDGMRLWLYDGVEAPTLQDIPKEPELEKMVRKVAGDLVALRAAPVAEPYTGPAILKTKAAGVFFHETFGHRIEGHRQKDESEGRTFSKKIGTRIMPEFITVSDDPTLQRHGEKPLNGHYIYDDEGVPAQKVTLVDKGVLKTFLMGRSPIRNFPKSNGHGRCSPGRDPVARQANLLIKSDKKVPYSELREMLIAQCKKQGKSYGLIFDEIAGGFTMTQSYMPQVYKLLPLRVWKIFTDGSPDQLVRGLDLVGTPLASLERIACGADDDDTFNGTCGAESGWVPVSATAPSLLVETIEVERQQKAQNKPPLLPSPIEHEGNGNDKQISKQPR